MTTLKNKIYFSLSDCSLGLILVAKSNRGICAVTLGDNQNELLEDLRYKFPHHSVVEMKSECSQAILDVIHLLDKPSTKFQHELDIHGTVFQQRVWQALQEIPLGETVSYTDIAIKIGSPKSVRAVAQACGANKLAIIIPCHRVIKRDGSLSGYRWGVERKKWLLEREILAS